MATARVSVAASQEGDGRTARDELVERGLQVLSWLPHLISSSLSRLLNPMSFVSFVSDLMDHRRRLLFGRGLLASGVLLGAGSAVAAPAVFSLNDARIEIDASSYISNGKGAKACALPAIARLKMGGSLCTGTLVHPQVIAYAAHCGPLRSAQFGESGQGPGLTSFKSTRTNPGFNINKLDTPDGEPMDWAFAVLPKPLNGVPIIPFASRGEYKVIMETNAPIMMAGFGYQGAGKGAGAQMMWTENELGQTSNGWIQAGLGTKNACPGDSGGPLLAQLPDKSWRVIGIASTLYGETQNGNANCGRPESFNHYARVRPEMLRWFEKSTGHDVTPCYDVEGNEDKTDACSGFFAGDPTSPSGSWSSGNCSGANKVDSPKLYPVDDDDKSPTAELTWPKDKSVYGPGQTIEVRVKAEDDKKMGTVSLSVNHMLVKQWDKPPYVFEWKLEDEPTEYQLRATARDEAGNESTISLIQVDAKAGEKGPEKDPDAKDEEEEESEKEDEGGKEKESEKDEEGEKDKESEKDEKKSEDEESKTDDEEDKKSDKEDSEKADSEKEESDEDEDSDEKSKESSSPEATKGGSGGCVMASDPLSELGFFAMFAGLGFWRRRR